MLFDFIESTDYKDKIAVIKLGSRIALSSSGTSGGTGEALSIIKILITAGYQVDAYTKILKNDSIPKDFDIYNIEDYYNNINEKNYKALIVLNGNVNYFGGVDDPSQTLNFHIINNFVGPVFYVLCDCNLFLKQIWKSIENKPWANNYCRKNIEITRDDIVYISQPRDIDETIKIARKFINIKDCVHFPFEKFPLLTSNYLNFNDNPIYDLLYGGTFRGGKREEDMIKFYFGYNNFKVSMFGKISASNFKSINLKYPEFEGAIPYDLFNKKMNESKATIIIGDPIYKKLDDLAQRIYESILSRNVVFIDESYDHNKLVFSNSELVDFCYVSSRDDVENRLKKLEDSQFRKYITELQEKDIKFDKIEYSMTLKNIIEGFIS